MTRRTTGRAAGSLAAALIVSLGAGPAAAQRDRIIPENTVVQGELSQSLSSRTAREGDRVTVTLHDDDRSGFPRGTQFEGEVIEVRRAERDRPAVIDLGFRRAILPDGASQSIDAELAGLSADDTRRTESGRLESRPRGEKFDWKWVGVGAAGGAVLGEIFGSNLLRGLLIGAAGGAIYSYLNRGKDRDRSYQDLTLDRGTDLGIRLRRDFAFREDDRYSYNTTPYRDDVLGRRDDTYQDDRYRDDRYRDDRYRDDRYRDDRYREGDTYSRLAPRDMVRDLARVDYDRVRNNLVFWRVTPASRALDSRDLDHLSTLLRDDSTARRQGERLTDLLRSSGRLNSGERVVGADLRDSILYVR